MDREEQHDESVSVSSGAGTFQRPVLAVVVAVWVILFLAIAALSQLPRGQAAVPGEAGNDIAVGKAFSLQQARPSSIRVFGGVPLRVEDDGLAVLDAAGHEQSFIQYAYREPHVFDAGEALLIAPASGTEAMFVLPDHSTREIGVKEIIQGGDYRDGYVLTLGQSAKSVGVVTLYKLSREEPLIKLPIAEQGRPVRVAFAPGGGQFDVLLVDFSGGTPATRILRYDFSGDLIFDRSYTDTDLMPAFLHLGEGETAFYSDHHVAVVSDDTGEVRASLTFEQIVQVERQAGRLAILGVEDGQTALYYLPGPSSMSDKMFIRADAPVPLKSFALSSDGMYALGASGDEWMLFDTITGNLLARRRGLDGTERVLTVGMREFLVLTSEDQASIVTIR